MTKDKDFKDLVHARAAETGEKYTAARERLLEEGAEDAPPVRIFGLENRYSVSADVAGHGRLSAAEVARYLFRRSASWGGRSNVYLANGARLYVPQEGVIEYATPECSSAREALCHVRAGESLLVELARLAEGRLAEEGAKAVVEVAVDRSAAGGGHESYAAPRSFPTERLHQMLVPFLVTRQVFSGSGGIVDTSDGPRFAISPRAYQLSTTSDGSTSQVVDADASPHADTRRFRRIHVAVGDVNRSDAATLLKTAMTRLVLRLMEEVVPGALGYLPLVSPRKALHDIALDPTCGATIDLSVGPRLTALDVQDLILRDVRRHLAETSATNEERRTVDQWQSLIDGLRSDPASLSYSLEWVGRLRHLQGVGDNLADAVELDRGLDRIGPDDAAFLAHRLCSEEEVDLAGRSAPPRTRAFTRARFIEACVNSRRDYTVDWSHLKLNDQANGTFIMGDPFRMDDARLEKFLAHVAAGPAKES